jgi:hypothetical protein
MAIDTPLIGASLLQVWKPLAAPGAPSDATAPFALGTVVSAEPGKIAQFVRAAATIAIGGTTGVTNGVTVAAAGGNTWTNGTGQAIAIGDYLFVTSTPAILP